VLQLHRSQNVKCTLSCARINIVIKNDEPGSACDAENEICWEIISLIEIGYTREMDLMTAISFDFLSSTEPHLTCNVANR